MICVSDKIRANVYPDIERASRLSWNKLSRFSLGGWGESEDRCWNWR